MSIGRQIDKNFNYFYYLFSQIYRTYKHIVLLFYFSVDIEDNNVLLYY